MTGLDDRWVEKVHPKARAVEVDDPLELIAEPVAGDPAVMLQCVLQEFLWLGWNTPQLLSLFHNPGYPVLCQLREYFGDEEVRHQVESLVERCGIMRFHETIAEPDLESENEAELIQITLNAIKD